MYIHAFSGTWVGQHPGATKCIAQRRIGQQSLSATFNTTCCSADHSRFRHHPVSQSLPPSLQSDAAVVPDPSLLLFRCRCTAAVAAAVAIAAAIAHGTAVNSYCCW